MAQQSLRLQQKTSQQMALKLSQQQIFAVELLGMGSAELREEIYKTAQENPALIITKDYFSEGSEKITSLKAKKSYGPLMPYTKVAKRSLTQENASQSFQEMLESSPDKQETLQENLLHQLNMTNLTVLEAELCKKLIENLDQNGHHILAPETLTNQNNKNLLEKCIHLIQNFYPVGTCTRSVEESLLVQAQQKGISNPLVTFILSGHLDFISPPIPEKAEKKIKNFLKQEATLAFQKTPQIITEKDVSQEKIAIAIEKIKTLNPYPARDFYTGEEVHFIQPDAEIFIEQKDEETNFEKGIIKIDSEKILRVRLSDGFLPEVSLSLDLKNEENKKNEVIAEQVKKADFFIQTLEYRKKTLLTAISHLAEIQKDFFIFGTGHLNPLSQRDFASIIKVHESTVSRMAQSKFIRCSLGTFPVQYFFSSAVTKTQSEQNVSSDSVAHKIAEILKNQKQGEKPLSDQKIADLLSEQGIKIARRTVAKYRTKLNLASSYDR